MKRTGFIIGLAVSLLISVCGCTDDPISDKLTASNGYLALNVSTRTITSGFMMNDVQFDIESSGVNWIIEESPSWVTVSPKMGSGNGTVKITFKLNDGQERSGQLIVNSNDNEWPVQIPITLKQEANQKYSIETVDMGLSVKWANVNLGAKKVSDKGAYIAWGEKSVKNSYDISNYTFGNGSSNAMSYSKYYHVPQSDFKTLGDSILEQKDDAASSILGDDWRMPTADELRELLSNTHVVNTQGECRLYSTVSGFTDKYIVIPSSGIKSGTGYKSDAIDIACFWTSTVSTDIPLNAQSLRIISNGTNPIISSVSRYMGLPVRPVSELGESDITAINLNFTSLILAPGERRQLNASVMVGDRSTDVFKLAWASDKESVVTVSDNGLITAKGQGTATVTAGVGEKRVSCVITVKTVTPEYVDLGLGVRWATFNVGAAVPEGSGYFFAWGETKQKDSYTWDNYKYNSNDKLSKYCLYTSSGTYDGLDELERADDAATATWGSDWRTPTRMELSELILNSSQELTEVNGVAGYKFTSTVKGFEGKSIFIPFTGLYEDNLTGQDSCGYYQTNTLYYSNDYRQYIFYSDYSNKGGYISWREYGMAIRAVRPFGQTDITGIKTNGVKSYQVGEYSSVVIDAQAMVGSRTVDYELTWKSSDESIAKVANGIVSTIKEGKCTVTVSVGNVKESFEITVQKASPQYVDLGLSVLWASFNLGALDNKSGGGFYSWGETESKTQYEWTTYKWGKSSDALTKYNNNSNKGYNGFTDNKSVLEKEDDAANIIWGDGWRTPSPDEWAELLNEENCSRTWVNNYQSSGLDGYVLTGKKSGFENRSIFLPLAGYVVDNIGYATTGRYWTNTVGATQQSSNYIYFTSSDILQYSYYRPHGYSIRPVKDLDVSNITSLVLKDGIDAITLSMSSTYQLEAFANLGEDRLISVSATWKSDDTSVASVSESGLVTPKGIGSCVITGTYGKFSVTCKVTVDGHDFVDLGLSVLWATCNIGASNPEDFGDYYAWGETETKTEYSYTNYKWSKGSGYSLTKYCNDSSYGNNNYSDTKTTLDPDDDVAHVKWGGNWRMPSHAEIEELIKNCTVEDVKVNGVEGIRFTSNIPGYTGRSVFLPGAGRRIDDGVYGVGNLVYYFSGSLYNEDPRNAYTLSFNYGARDYWDYESRSYGLPIRPVFPSDTWVKEVSIELNSESLGGTVPVQKGVKIALIPTVRDGVDIVDYSVAWTSDNKNIATVDSKGVITGVSTGTTTIKATCIDATATCVVNVVDPPTDKENGHDFVYMGLSVNWATCNVGATKPEGYGNYYAWGETTTKSTYNWTNYKHGTTSTLNKYSSSDGKKVLESVDDAASVNWGGGWRIPTYYECYELINYCNWMWTSYNGVNGYLITNRQSGYESNFVFLPAAASMWDSTLSTSIGSWGAYTCSTIHSFDTQAYLLSFHPTYYEVSVRNRASGTPIRAVCQ